MIYDIGKSIKSSLKSLSSTSPNKFLNNISRNLILEGIPSSLILQIKTELKQELLKYDLNNDQEVERATKFVYKIIYSNFLQMLTPKNSLFNPLNNLQSVVLFVGLQGVGKTTTVSKYGMYYRRRGLKVGIVCADTFRAGAYDQLSQNCSKIGVHLFDVFDIDGSGVGGNSNNSNTNSNNSNTNNIKHTINIRDPVEISYLGTKYFKSKGYQLILVDTSGRNIESEGLITEMNQIALKIEPDHTVMVIDAGIGPAVLNQAKMFNQTGSAADRKSIILTKLDGAERTGHCLEALKQTDSPISFTCNGEKMTEIEIFEPRKFLNKIFNRTDFENIKERIDNLDIDQNKILDNVMNNVFLLKDFKSIMVVLENMGPISDIMKMMPVKLDMPDKNEMRKIKALFNSLSKKELEGSGDEIKACIDRKRRIARGAGIEISYVNKFLMQFNGMKTMFQNTGMMSQMRSLMNFQ